MDIGIPKQKRPFDYRVGLTPMGVEILTEMGHRCYVESGAGQGSGFDDERYRQAGAQIVYSTAGGLRPRGDDPLGIAPTAQRVRAAARRPDPCAAFCTWPSLIRPSWSCSKSARSRRSPTRRSRLDDGELPVLQPISQIAGRMIASEAARLLQNNEGGHGILLGGVPGVPPAKVVIAGRRHRGPERRQDVPRHGRGPLRPRHRPAQATGDREPVLGRHAPWSPTISTLPGWSSWRMCWSARC